MRRSFTGDASINYITYFWKIKAREQRFAFT